MAAIRLCALMLLPALIIGAGTAHGQPRQPRPLSANPSVFVAADIGFSRMTQDRGMMAAVREYGEADAQILSPQDSPQPVLAKHWAKRDMAGFRLQPQLVMVSCDGNMAVTKGAWISAETRGSYVSIWARDSKGRLKWRVHQRSADLPADLAPAPIEGKAGLDDDASPDNDDDFIRTRQAACRPKTGSHRAAPKGALPSDDSLDWTIQPTDAGDSALTVRLWNGEVMETVIAPAIELAHE